jgi:formylglycine-generating enzyme required for sulfatase activity
MVVRPGRPVVVFPEARTADGPAKPTPAPTESDSPPAPRPASAEHPAAPAPRSCAGCLALLMVAVASMIFAWVFLLRPDGGPPADTSPDGPRPGPVTGMLLVRFPAGRLDPSYGPTRSFVDVPRDFELSATEVTHEQFGQFVRVTAYQTDAEKGAGDQGRGAVLRKIDGESSWVKTAAWDTWRTDLPPDTPVVCVSWEDAVRFCNWLSEREKLPPCYSLQGGPGGGWTCDFQKPGYRLPTEAEWEYAARAGERDLYPTPGDKLRGYGWFMENSGGYPHPVGGKAKNSRDLCDVWGNVWEWCWDWSGAAASRGGLRPAGPETGVERVTRGGGWCDPAPTKAEQTRKARPPDYRASDLGFRVARTLPHR